MRYVSIDDAKPGMRLAYELFDANNRIMIGSNKALTETLIMRLRDLGFKGLYIDDEMTTDIVVEPVISQELREAGIACMKEQNIDRCIEIAQSIVDEIITNGTIRVDMMDLRTYDDYTYAHSVNVAVLCCVVGLCMELELADLDALVTAALLHDLGKLNIGADILYKKQRLTPEEYRIMKGHVVRSYEIIADRTDLSAAVKQTVLGHHENVDGSGYPQGLTGDEQTLLMKIIHVADVYDALTTKRPYKKPYFPCEAMEYLMGACGTYFDLEVVSHFMKCVPLFPKGTEVCLSDGRKGIVMENRDLHNLRPVLHMLDGGTVVDLAQRENLSLTIVSHEETQNDSPGRQEDSRRKMISQNRRPSVLIVDDEVESQNRLISILSEKYDIAVSDSGENALGHLKEAGRPDLVIMDMDMPKMDGVVTAALMNSMYEEPLHILYTAEQCDVATVNKALQGNASGYLIRPLRSVYVKSEVERIINGWSEFQK